MLFGAGMSLVTIVLSYAALSLAFRTAKQPQMLVVFGGFVLRLGLLYGLLALAARTLQEMGFTRVVSLREGWSGWTRRGYPVEG